MSELAQIFVKKVEYLLVHIAECTAVRALSRPVQRTFDVYMKMGRHSGRQRRVLNAEVSLMNLYHEAQQFLGSFISLQNWNANSNSQLCCAAGWSRRFADSFTADLKIFKGY